ncbi:sulfite exporter TauE/SafE family protein [Christensenellaceae bacterium OttesenSCG-928-M15]|nr:sulfite exporter TauE/SafE family protein [Christensenellaceae bacterium OttesenSCG-928-M15]
MEWLWFLLSGAAAGVISGMGMGGGTILIPMLTIFLSVDQHAAQGINMLAFLPGAALALIVHKKEKRLETKEGWPMLLWGAIGAAAGALLATFLDAGWLKKGFGIFLVILAILQWKKISKQKTEKADKN